MPKKKNCIFVMGVKGKWAQLKRYIQFCFSFSLFRFSLCICTHTQKKHPDLASLQAQSTGEDSNSSDHSAASDTGDYDDTMNGSMDQRFSSFLGLQGIPGLLPGPSGMHNDSFGKFSLTTFIFNIIG